MKNNSKDICNKKIYIYKICFFILLIIFFGSNSSANKQDNDDLKMIGAGKIGEGEVDYRYNSLTLWVMQ
jgi:hypothetical protein